MRVLTIVTLGLAALAWFARPSVAGPVRSEYTTIELKQCKAFPKPAEEADGDAGGAWWCPGLKGYKLYFAEGDLRTMIAYGKKAREQRAATQTLGRFNSIFVDDKTERATMEWRMRYSKGKWLPFATILRYHTFDGEQDPPVRGQVLVVAKVGPTGRHGRLPRRLRRCAGQSGCQRARPTGGRREGRKLRLHEGARGRRPDRQEPDVTVSLAR